MAPKHRELAARAISLLNRVFGVFALIIGVSFTGRVVAALVRGLTLRQVWLAGILGLALTLVGVLYLRTPLTRN
jgi:hypothetical protein